MILIVGLGNPGKKYKKTRHNIGFRVVDELVMKHETYNMKQEKKFDSIIWHLKWESEKTILAKPFTFMNNSGRAVKHLITNYKIPFTHMWVIHDDIDLPLGTIRVSQNVSSGGHKGVESIIQELRTKDFIRFRIGINHETCNMKHEAAEKFVLERFSQEEEKAVEKVIKKVVEIIKESFKTGITKKTTIKI